MEIMCPVMRNWAPSLGLVLVLLAPLQQSPLSDYKNQFAHENEPVHKARLLARMGDLEVDEMGKKTDEEDFDGALKDLGEYRDEIIQTQKGLHATGVNAEKNPAGFKQLQISLRRNLRRLNDIVTALPLTERERFMPVQRQLENLDHELIRALFPRRPHEGDKEQPGGSPADPTKSAPQPKAPQNGAEVGSPQDYDLRRGNTPVAVSAAARHTPSGFSGKEGC
jgi:hypothetical protein